MAIGPDNVLLTGRVAVVSGAGSHFESRSHIPLVVGQRHKVDAGVR